MNTNDLIKSLKICADSADPIDECEFKECSLHKDCDSMCLSRLLNEAADRLRIYEGRIMMEDVYGICTTSYKLKNDAYKTFMSMMSERMNQDFLEQVDDIRTQHPYATENELIRFYIEEGWCFSRSICSIGSIWEAITQRINAVEFNKSDYPFYCEFNHLFVRKRIPLTEDDAIYTLKQVDEIFHRWIDPLLEAPVCPTWYTVEG